MAGDLLPIDLAEMIAEIERELAMRAQVYPRQVAEGRMTQRLADRRVAVLREIARALAAVHQQGGWPAGQDR